MGGGGGGVVDALGGFDEVGGGGLGDGGEGLGVEVGEGEPGALDLDHDAVAAEEGVAGVGHVVVEGGDLVGLEGLGGGEGVAKAGTHGFAADEQLVVGEGAGGGGVEVDEFDVEVGVGGGGGDVEAGEMGPASVRSAGRGSEV